MGCFRSPGPILGVSVPQRQEARPHSTRNPVLLPGFLDPRPGRSGVLGWALRPERKQRMWFPRTTINQTLFLWETELQRVMCPYCISRTKCLPQFPSSPLPPSSIGEGPLSFCCLSQWEESLCSCWLSNMLPFFVISSGTDGQGWEWGDKDTWCWHEI